MDGAIDRRPAAVAGIREADPLLGVTEFHSLSVHCDFVVSAPTPQMGLDDALRGAVDWKQVQR